MSTLNSTQENVAQDNETKYSLNCINESSVPWVFYVYQTLPNQANEVFSLAWFASPYKVTPTGHIEFSWTIDYSFVWGEVGILKPGIEFEAGESLACDLKNKNEVTFCLDNNIPQFKDLSASGQKGSLTINEADDVPNSRFSTGIAMSNNCSFVQAALQNTSQVYTPKPKYWIAAAKQMQMGEVLAQTISHAKEISFNPNIYHLEATFHKNNTWSISEK